MTSPLWRPHQRNDHRHCPSHPTSPRPRSRRNHCQCHLQASQPFVCTVKRSDFPVWWSLVLCEPERRVMKIDSPDDLLSPTSWWAVRLWWFSFFFYPRLRVLSLPWSSFSWWIMSFSRSTNIVSRNILHFPNALDCYSIIHLGWQSLKGIQ